MPSHSTRCPSTGFAAASFLVGLFKVHRNLVANSMAWFPAFAEMRDRVMERERGLIRSGVNRSNAHGDKATVRAAQVVAQASDRSSTPAGKTNSTMASDEGKCTS